MIRISKPTTEAIESIHKPLRHYGAKWCRLTGSDATALFAFATLTGIPAKFFKDGSFLVPADMRAALIKAGAEPD